MTAKRREQGPKQECMKYEIDDVDSGSRNLESRKRYLSPEPYDHFQGLNSPSFPIVPSTTLILSDTNHIRSNHISGATFFFFWVKRIR